MPSLYVNSFRPLAFRAAGVLASERQGIPPFVDGSIRREPDFEHPFPAITCLCRGNKFAPRLTVGDNVVYLTVKSGYAKQATHRRLVAVLEVARLFPSHKAAADWYRQQGLALPNNLMVPGNPPKPVSQSHGHTKHRATCGADTARKWDCNYEARASHYPTVVQCRTRYVNVGWSAPVVDDPVLIDVFGIVPGTRNPGAHDLTLLPVLLDRLGIRAAPSSP